MRNSRFSNGVRQARNSQTNSQLALGIEAGALRALYSSKKEAAMSSLAIYLIGLVIFIAGLVYGAHLLHVPEKWIGVGLVVLVGLGVLMGAIKTRQRDSGS